MRVFYNEWDKKTSKWLEELGNANELPKGEIDTRSIRDVRADDLRDFDQCHFFSGIGGWPLALRWSGLEGTPGIWTGSPPCQPFSVAGKGLGQADERHLAPVWLDLIRECRPRLIFGEQVAAAICSGSDLRLLGLSPAAVVAACLYAAHVGSIEPTAFLRRFAIMGHDGATSCREAWREFATAAAIYTPEYSITDAAFRAIEGVRQTGWLDDLFDTLEECGYACGAAVLPACSVGSPHIRKRLFFGAVRLADAHDARPQGRAGMPERTDEQPAGAGSVEGRPADPHQGFWSGADWLGCRDGKFRPVEPGTQPLATGISARVVRLRGYGNAIVPQVAAQFVMSFMEALGDMRRE